METFAWLWTLGYNPSAAELRYSSFSLVWRVHLWQQPSAKALLRCLLLREAFSGHSDGFGGLDTAEWPFFHPTTFYQHIHNPFLHVLPRTKVGTVSSCVRWDKMSRVVPVKKGNCAGNNSPRVAWWLLINRCLQFLHVCGRYDVKDIDRIMPGSIHVHASNSYFTFTDWKDLEWALFCKVC